MQELGLKQDAYVVPIIVKSATNLSRNATQQAMAKHINVWYHEIQDLIENQMIQLKKIHTNGNLYIRHYDKSPTKKQA